MERIVLELDGSLASAWNRVPVEIKKQFTRDIKARLEEQIRIAEKDEFEKALADIRQQAADNGLTPEILEELLNEED